MEKKKIKVDIYFNMVKRGYHILLQDNTGSFWGVYESMESAKKAVPNLKRRHMEELRKRGIIKTIEIEVDDARPKKFFR